MGNANRKMGRNGAEMIADTFARGTEEAQKFRARVSAWKKTKVRGKITWSLDGEDMLGFDLTGDEEKDVRLFRAIFFSAHNMLFNREHPELVDD